MVQKGTGITNKHNAAAEITFRTGDLTVRATLHAGALYQYQEIFGNKAK